MRISRIHTDRDLEPGSSLTLDGKPSHYLANVLRLRQGSLGPRILRTETAGPATVAVLQAVCGDF